MLKSKKKTCAWSLKLYLNYKYIKVLFNTIEFNFSLKPAIFAKNFKFNQSY